MSNLFLLAELQQIAQVACFSLDYQKKLQAEQYFLEFTKNISSGILLEVLRSGSDTLVFVVVEYANKLVEEYSLEFLKELFNTVETEVNKWYVPESHEFRKGSITLINGNIQQFPPKQITKYVMNSIAFFMSNCMKRFFIQDTFEKRNQIVTWISNKTNERYKLWLFTIFIQNISQIDQTMGFIKFRSLSYNFQEEVIPIISKCIIPFLFKVEDIMKVNQISEMQENLQVQEENVFMGGIKKEKIFMNENEFKFAQLVFQLLHNLVFYNFHLTYTEYEQEATFENCLICFPEQFTAKVVNEEFIGSMGYVIERLIDLMPKSNFLKTTLQCLQKIFLTKLSYVDEERKMSFIKECTTMLTKCLNKQNLDQSILTKLMVCNNKFLNNVDISYLKEKPQLSEAFHQWLLTITKTTFLVLQNIQLSQQFNFNLEESLVIQCLELYHKIVTSISTVSYVAFEEMTLNNSQQKQYIAKNVESMTAILIRKLLMEQSRPLIEESTAQIFKSNILQIKSFCGCFFQPFKQLASLNYGFFFSEIEKSMDMALSTGEISVKFNLFMLLCQVLDRNFLQRNIVMVKASEQQIFILSSCINKALKFLESYLKSKQEIVLNEQIILMDISILLFFDKVLSQFLCYFQNHETTIQIKQRIFLNIVKIQNKQAFASNLSEEFILFCVQSVLSFLLIYNKSQQSHHINDFIFETINRILMKFKWGIKREVFKSSQIYIKLEQFFTQVEKQTSIVAIVPQPGIDPNLVLFHQFQRLKWRKKLLKVIALLYFDDIIDDYRRNLENIFLSLKNQHILTILLDIEGIGEAIDTSSIYKTFLQMTEKYFSIDGLTSELVKFACSFNGYDNISQKYPRVKIIKEIMKMHKAVLSNKGQRIGNPKNLQSVYFMIMSLIKYWIEFLKMAETEEWLPVVREIVNTISELIKCDKINFYLVERMCREQFVVFLAELFQKMLNMSDRIEENPKFYQAYLAVLVNMSRELLEVIFFPSVRVKSPELNPTNIQILQSFLQLFISTFKKVPDFLEQFKIGNTKNETYLQKSIEIVKFTLVFIESKRKQQILHKQQMQEINSFVAQMKPLIFQYSNQLVSYLSTEKHFSVHRRTLIILLYEGTLIYPQLMETLIGEMKLPNYLLNQAKQCLEFIKREQQELFIDRLKTWLRMIHMTEEEIKKNREHHRDFYGFMGII